MSNKHHHLYKVWSSIVCLTVKYISEQFRNLVNTYRYILMNHKCVDIKWESIIYLSVVAEIPFSSIIGHSSGTGPARSDLQRHLSVLCWYSLSVGTFRSYPIGTKQPEFLYCGIISIRSDSVFVVFVDSCQLKTVHPRRKTNLVRVSFLTELKIEASTKLHPNKIEKKNQNLKPKTPKMAYL